MIMVLVTGIKVDTGAKSLAGSPDEKITEGLRWFKRKIKRIL